MTVVEFYVLFEFSNISKYLPNSFQTLCHQIYKFNIIFEFSLNFAEDFNDELVTGNFMPPLLYSFQSSFYLIILSLECPTNLIVENLVSYEVSWISRIARQSATRTPKFDIFI
jgi:hypothetical protein